MKKRIVKIDLDQQIAKTDWKDSRGFKDDYVKFDFTYTDKYHLAFPDYKYHCMPDVYVNTRGYNWRHSEEQFWFHLTLDGELWRYNAKTGIWTDPDSKRSQYQKFYETLRKHYNKVRLKERKRKGYHISKKKVDIQARQLQQRLDFGQEIGKLEKGVEDLRAAYLKNDLTNAELRAKLVEFFYVTQKAVGNAKGMK